MSGKLGIPLVATNDCHYLNKKDAKAHEILLCVQTQKDHQRSRPVHFRFQPAVFQIPEEMSDYFADFPEPLTIPWPLPTGVTSSSISRPITFPSSMPSRAERRRAVRRAGAGGYERRMAVVRKKHPDLDEAVYRERLEYEIKTIIDMGLPGYFLIVADFIRYAKENGMPVGPGAGRQPAAWFPLPWESPTWIPSSTA
jgi:DNA polymerase-3 subunit alpha